MTFTPTAIADVWIIEPRRLGDARGYFMETWHAGEIAERTGRPYTWVQENESCSQAGVLRGLHMQRGERGQAKLVRVTRGRVWDVAVDMRAGSATRGRYVAVELSADNGRQLLIPRGFAHGFYVLEGPAQFQYKVDNAYCPEAEATVRWDDPDLAVAWPITPGTAPLLSDKDRRGLPFRAFDTDSL